MLQTIPASPLKVHQRSSHRRSQTGWNHFLASKLIFGVAELPCKSRYLSRQCLQSFTLIDTIFCCRYYLITGEYPFKGDNVYRLFESIGQGLLSLPDSIVEPLRSLLDGMLKKDPKDRFSLQQIRHHPLVTNLFIPVILDSIGKV